MWFLVLGQCLIDFSEIRIQIDGKALYEKMI